MSYKIKGLRNDLIKPLSTELLNSIVFKSNFGFAQLIDIKKKDNLNIIKIKSTGLDYDFEVQDRIMDNIQLGSTVIVF